jgi:hypothetical protein
MSGAVAMQADGEEYGARLLRLVHGPAEVARRSREIYETVVRRSRNVVQGNFTAIAPGDLRLLFELYDAAFFEGLPVAMLRDASAELTFRLSRRMTSSAGTTARLRVRGAAVPGTARPDRYEITVSILLLFNNFHGAMRPVSVGGLICIDRLEALQRVFEHELLHLAEFLAWGQSSCAQARFLRLSQQIFGHSVAGHVLVTPREVAATTYDIRVGDAVSFEHEGVRRGGRVRRITRRATVLVEDPGGEPHSDGKHYRTFYVPLSWLSREETSTHE